MDIICGKLNIFTNPVKDLPNDIQFSSKNTTEYHQCLISNSQHVEQKILESLSVFVDNMLADPNYYTSIVSICEEKYTLRQNKLLELSEWMDKIIKYYEYFIRLDPSEQQQYSSQMKMAKKCSDQCPELKNKIFKLEPINIIDIVKKDFIDKINKQFTIKVIKEYINIDNVHKILINKILLAVIKDPIIEKLILKYFEEKGERIIEFHSKDTEYIIEKDDFTAEYIIHVFNHLFKNVTCDTLCDAIMSPILLTILVFLNNDEKEDKRAFLNMLFVKYNLDKIILSMNVDNIKELIAYVTKYDIKYLKYFEKYIISNITDHITVVSYNTTDLSSLEKNFDIFAKFLPIVDVNITENYSVFVEYLFKIDIRSKNKECLELIYANFPQYVADHWNIYLENTEKVTNIMNYLNLKTNSIFKKSLESWIETKNINNEFKNLRIQSNVPINKDIMSLSVSQSDMVGRRIDINAFVPMLKPYVKTIYSYCDKKYENGKYALNCKKCIVTVKINGKEYTDDILTINILCCVGMFVSPSEHDIKQMLSFDKQMVDKFNQMLRNKILICDTHVKINIDESEPEPETKEESKEKSSIVQVSQKEEPVKKKWVEKRFGTKKSTKKASQHKNFIKK